MKCLKRNMRKFTYRKYLGESDYDEATGEYAGEPVVMYDEPVEYEGNISTPNGVSNQTMYGVDTRYTHVLTMDNPQADIEETGLIEWNGRTYEVIAVRPSLNVLTVGLRKRTGNAAGERT